MSYPGWVGRGGVGITDFPNIQVLVCYLNPKLYFFEKKKGEFRPHLDTFIGGRMIADTKLTVVRWCQIFTESAHLSNSVIESQYPDVCLSVCYVVKNPLPEVMETSGQRAYC